MHACHVIWPYSQPPLPRLTFPPLWHLSPSTAFVALFYGHIISQTWTRALNTSLCESSFLHFPLHYMQYDNLPLHLFSRVIGASSLLWLSQRQGVHEGWYPRCAPCWWCWGWALGTVMEDVHICVHRGSQSFSLDFCDFTRFLGRVTQDF